MIAIEMGCRSRVMRRRDRSLTMILLLMVEPLTWKWLGALTSIPKARYFRRGFRTHLGEPHKGFLSFGGPAPPSAASTEMNNGKNAHIDWCTHVTCRRLQLRPASLLPGVGRLRLLRRRPFLVCSSLNGHTKLGRVTCLSNEATDATRPSGTPA